MSARSIIYLNDKEVKKVIPTFEELNNCKFLSYGELRENEVQAGREIYNLLKNTSSLCRLSVIQQYNEWYVYEYADKELKEILAPVIWYSEDERRIPILKAPKFTPLASDTTFYKYSEEETLIQLGRVSQTIGYSFWQLKDFITKVKKLCEDFELNEEDIIYNLSNLGYNKEYGLRVIDYGLAYDKNNLVWMSWYEGD